MNTPPIFAVCNSDAVVTSYLREGNILRLFMAGIAPQNVKKPYAVWQTTSGSPFNHISGSPNTESHMLQIDVYALSMKEAKNVANAIEKAIEPYCYVTNYNMDEQEEDTKLWRSSFDVEWITYR